MFSREAIALWEIMLQTCHIFAPEVTQLKSVLSHVVVVLQIYYLISSAGGWLSQHCCVVATATLYKSQ